MQVRFKEGQPNSTYLSFKYMYIQFLNFISRNLFFTVPQPSPLVSEAQVNINPPPHSF